MWVIFLPKTAFFLFDFENLFDYSADLFDANKNLFDANKNLFDSTIVGPNGGKYAATFFLLLGSWLLGGVCVIFLEKLK